MRRVLIRLCLAQAIVVALVSVPAAAPLSQTQPTAVGRDGAAASVDSLATSTAIETLRRGGNAVDATVAAAGVLGVVEPFSAGIGGGGFMLIRTSGGRVLTIDQREAAPAAMRPDSMMEAGRPLAFNDARFSGLSAGVPGTVRGWEEALRRYGTISLADALAPAIEIARQGFVVDGIFAGQIQGNLDYFDDVPSTRAVYLDPDGTAPDVGTIFRNPDLARAYERIAALGAAGFYSGPVAEALVAAVRNPPVAADANHRWRPGLMTTADLLAYAAPEREPTRVSYRGLDVYGMGPPSSGGSTVAEVLNILEGYDLGGMDRARAMHLYLEASRLAYADRNAFLADPAFYPVPLRGLLSKDFAATRRARINPDRAATSPVPPGDPSPFQTASVASGEPAVTVTGSGTTTHLTVADRSGNVVAYTFTIEAIGGNGVVVPGWGFLLNNELTDFNFDSLTHPNRIEGGKRPRSSMAPTIVLAGGQPFLALGSPGGATIPTTVLQLLIERIDLGATLEQAMATPRASQRNTATTTAEPTFASSPEGQALLTGFGHAFTLSDEIGAATAIEHLGNGRMVAAAEPRRRGSGSAMVVTPGRKGRER